jgi:PAS domain S-box-containing protein
VGVTQLADTTLIALLDGAPDAMLVIDEAGLIVLVNTQARQLFGYDQEELMGTPVECLVPIADPKFRPHATGLQLVGRRRDGSEFPTEVSVSTMTTATGLLISAAVRDATDRIEEAAKLVRISKKAGGVRLEAEAEHITAEGEKTVAAELVRVSKEAEDVRLDAEADRITAESEKTVAEGVRLEAEADRITAEDEKTVAEGVRVEAEAERERLEAQLNQSQRMESLGQLAGGIAHDFNNLLGVILNYAAFVAEELTSAAAAPTGLQWEEPLKDVKQIQLAAERGALLTRQLLSFARREVVQTRALSLNSAISRMEQILRRTIGEQIELVISLATNLPMVMADPGQIEQIVLNLAINARDAMPTGGTLWIDTAMSETRENGGSVSVIPPGLCVSLRVRDTGVGMSAQVRERAFEPFFTTKPRGEGSGLGLATVYGIVSQSGGYTDIYSDEGSGTSITILLPAAEQGAIRDEVNGRVDHRKPLMGTETILIVDDEVGQREVAQRILTRSGYTVLTASSGARAIELAVSHVGPIDLVVTDVIMPAMQGPTVAQEIRKLRPDIPVLFMSGHAQPVLETESLLGTDFPLMEKPFDEAKLLQNVREVLESNE